MAASETQVLKEFVRVGKNFLGKGWPHSAYIADTLLAVYMQHKYQASQPLHHGEDISENISET